jgi:hypothetical protein
MSEWDIIEELCEARAPLVRVRKWIGRTNRRLISEFEKDVGDIPDEFIEASRPEMERHLEFYKVLGRRVNGALFELHDIEQAVAKHHHLPWDCLPWDAEVPGLEGPDRAEFLERRRLSDSDAEQ